jgi:hypothetical protein
VSTIVAQRAVGAPVPLAVNCDIFDTSSNSPVFSQKVARISCGWWRLSYSARNAAGPGHGRVGRIRPGGADPLRRADPPTNYLSICCAPPAELITSLCLSLIVHSNLLIPFLPSLLLKERILASEQIVMGENIQENSLSELAQNQDLACIILLIVDFIPFFM